MAEERKASLPAPLLSRDSLNTYRGPCAVKRVIYSKTTDRRVVALNGRVYLSDTNGTDVHCVMACTSECSATVAAAGATVEIHLSSSAAATARESWENAIWTATPHDKSQSSAHALARAVVPALPPSDVLARAIDVLLGLVRNA